MIHMLCGWLSLDCQHSTSDDVIRGVSSLNRRIQRHFMQVVYSDSDYEPSDEGENVEEPRKRPPSIVGLQLIDDFDRIIAKHQSAGPQPKAYTSGCIKWLCTTLEHHRVEPANQARGPLIIVHALHIRVDRFLSILNKPQPISYKFMPLNFMSRLVSVTGLFV